MESHEGNEREGESAEGGSVREVYRVGWPIVVGMLSYTAMGVSDTLMVGWLGVTELAAVGLATTAVFLINSLFMGTLHGAKVIVSQATGAGRHEYAVRAGWQGALLALPFGLLVILLSGFDAVIFELMGGPADVQQAAREYFAVRVWASPFWYVTIALSDYYQGTGDTRTPMKVNLLVNGLNIVLDLALIFGIGPVPALGVEGAALATVIASVCGMMVIFSLFVRKVGFHPTPDAELMRRVLRVGAPIGVRYVLGVGGFTVFTAVVARVGEAELAANQIAIKIISLSFLPGYGISEAATVLTGQYLGARDTKSIRASFVSALKLSVGLMGVCGIVFWVAPEPLIRLFQDDPEVVAIASQLLMLAAIFQVFDAVAMTATGALNGIGDTQFTMYASIFGSWVVLVPLSYLFGIVLDLGAFGAWLALTTEIVLVAAVLTWRFAAQDLSKRASLT